MPIESAKMVASSRENFANAAMEQKAGRITAGGIIREVLFEAVDDAFNDRIDDAYRRKYKGSPYRKPMIGRHARAATVRVVPRQGKEKA